MAESLRTWDSEEWERHILCLLRVRHPIGQLVPVPDQHCGDFGLEAFTRCGKAYQCYAPDEPLSTNLRYEKQRDKITRDINKFIKNKDELVRLLGTTRISLWVLVTPRHDSAKLVQHATKKAQEVRDANLPYVSEDFQVHVETLADFDREHSFLVQSGLEHITIDDPEIDSQEIEDWAGQPGQGTQLAKLQTKIMKMRGAESVEQIRLIRDRFLVAYLKGLRYLDHLRDNYPEIWELVFEFKKAREAFLEAECSVATGTASEIFIEQRDRFRKDLLDRVKTMDPNTADGIVWEAVVDWLMRCPLDFSEA